MPQQPDSPPLPLSELALLVAAIVVTAVASFVLAYDQLGLSREPTPQLVEHLRTAAAVLWILWAARRNRTYVQRGLRRTEKLVGQRYEEGYAAGYVDGASHAAAMSERPSGTVYSIHGERPVRPRERT